MPHLSSFPQTTPADAETTRLRRQLRDMKEKARLSEETSRRCHEREIALLAASNLPELMNTLTEWMRQSFGLPSVSLVLYDPEHVFRYLLTNTGHPPESYPSIGFVDNLLDVSPVYADLSQPLLGPYQRSDHAPLFPGQTKLRSVAVLPLLRHGFLFGSLNLGSNDPTRYHSAKASDFLERLASISSVCLENTINREHLVVSGLKDALTGLHNRRYLDKRLAEEVARAQRHRQPLSCLFVDADYFKSINDHHGHDAGDEVLRELSRRVQECLRASDVAARFGGEEFALLLPQTNLSEAIRLAERIRALIAAEEINLGNGTATKVTVSIGVSELLANQMADGCELLKAADEALYRAKSNGRNGVSSHPAGD